MIAEYFFPLLCYIGVMSDEQSISALKSEVKGSGEPVVVVPGGLTGWLSLRPHAEQLSKYYKVILVQLLSVDLGLRNESLPKDYSVDFETSALKATLDQLGIFQADFVAWSYGAEITLNFALNNPERIRSLTLVEPPAIWILRSRGPLSKELLEEQKQIQLLGPSDINESQLEWFSHFAGFVPAHVDPRTLSQWPVWVQHRQSLRTGDTAFRHEDDIQRVRNFKKPVLLFKGEGSSDFLLKIIDILGEELPDAKVEMLPGGHALLIASMEQFLKILTSFLKSTRRTT